MSLERVFSEIAREKDLQVKRTGNKRSYFIIPGIWSKANFTAQLEHTFFDRRDEELALYLQRTEQLYGKIDAYAPYATQITVTNTQTDERRVNLMELIFPKNREARKVLQTLMETQPSYFRDELKLIRRYTGEFPNPIREVTEKKLKEIIYTVCDMRTEQPRYARQLLS